MSQVRLILLGLAAACVVVPSMEVAGQPGPSAGQSGAVSVPGAAQPDADQPPGAGPVSQDAPSSDPRDFNGLWTAAPVAPVAGGKGPPPPPFTLTNVPMLPATKAIIDKVESVRLSGRPIAQAQTSCRSVTPTAVLFPLFVTAIVQTPDAVFMLFVEPRLVRKIRLNGRHPSDLVPSYRGDSIGHWEGNTLVVDSIGFNGVGELDMAGQPVGARFHMIERITKAADGRSLDIEITISDPEYYSKPFTVTRKWALAAGQAQDENDCEESPRADADEQTVYLNDLFKPTCVRVEGVGAAPSHVVCRKPARVQ